MNNASEPSNIVSLSQRLDPSSERGGALLNTVRDIASRRLQLLVNGMFEHVDDALFDLAEKAENNAAQMHYFDGMRVIERGYSFEVSIDGNDREPGRLWLAHGRVTGLSLPTIEARIPERNDADADASNVVPLRPRLEGRKSGDPRIH